MSSKVNKTENIGIRRNSAEVYLIEVWEGHVPPVSPLWIRCCLDKLWKRRPVIQQTKVVTEYNSRLPDIWLLPMLLEPFGLHSALHHFHQFPFYHQQAISTYQSPTTSYQSINQSGLVQASLPIYTVLKKRIYIKGRNIKPNCSQQYKLHTNSVEPLHNDTKDDDKQCSPQIYESS